MTDELAKTLGGLSITGDQLSKEEYRQIAIDAGWTDTTDLDHEQYSLGKPTWMGSSHVYEFTGELGDIAPRDEKAEEYLYGSRYQMRQGEHIENLDLEVSAEGPERVPPFLDFAHAGLHPTLLENVQKASYKKPTAIQAYTIPAVLKGIDVVGISQTGSGKTAAYLIPVISKLMGKAVKLCAPRGGIASPLVVIVVPTRELAIQVFDEACRLTYRSMLRPCAVYGGMGTRDMKADLKKGCDFLVGTPGRLCDIMKQPEFFSMSRVKFTIIDEADELLSSDWSSELSMIMDGGDTNNDACHQYLMFSATFARDVRSLAEHYMSHDQYIQLTVGRAGSSHRNIIQDAIYVDRDQKSRCVYDLLMKSPRGRTLIFCNSKIAVDFLDDELYNKGFPTTSIHSGRGQAEREDSMRAFKTGRCPILIATGVSARGWDIKDIQHVINFDLPKKMYGGIDEYTHRIGRTARIGHTGHATSLYNDGDEDLAEDLVKVFMENGQEVPDFLEQYKPADGKLFFENYDDEEKGDEDGETTSDTNGEEEEA